MEEKEKDGWSLTATRLENPSDGPPFGGDFSERCYYPFLLADQRQKYTILLCNYLSLGQFELARATLHQLASLDPEEALTLLKDLICNGPPSEWLCSTGVPSAAHLAWLCVTEYNALRETLDKDKGNSEKIPQPILQRIEFELLLYCCFDPVEGVNVDNLEEVLRDLQRYYQRLQDPRIPEVPLSSPTLLQLKKVFVKVPLLGYSMYRHLTHPAVAEDTTRRTTWGKDLQALYVEIVKEFWNKGEREQAIDYLQYLDHQKIDTAVLNDLFQTFIAFCSSSSAAASSEKVSSRDSKGQDQSEYRLRLMHRLYESLIAAGSRDDVDGNHTLLRHYLALQDTHLARKSKEEPLTSLLPFEQLRLAQEQWEKDPTSQENTDSWDTARRRIWEGIYSLAAATGRHFLSLIVEEALRLVRGKAYDDLSLLLLPFAVLKPLIFLLAWDIYIGDIPARKRIIDLLWTSFDQVTTYVDDLVEEKCSLLSYQMRVACWCCAKMLLLPEEQQREVTIGNRPLIDLNQSPFQLTDGLLQTLSVHSFLYTVRSCLSRLDIGEVKEIINSHPAKTVQAQCDREKDSVVVSGYYVLKSIVSLFLEFHEQAQQALRQQHWDQKEDELSEMLLGMTSRMEEELDKAYLYLEELASVHYKLIILEDVFCLLFLTSHHLNANPSNDLNSPPKHVAVPFLVAGVLKFVQKALLSMGDVAYSDSDPKRKPHQAVEFGMASSHDTTFTLRKHPSMQSDEDLEQSREEDHQASYSSLQRRANHLWNRVNEGLWRHRIISSLQSRSSLFGSSALDSESFMNQMLASPPALLSLCLRMNDFEECKNIITYFRLDSPEAKEAALAEKLALLRIASSAISLESILAEMKEGSVRWVITNDMAMTVNGSWLTPPASTSGGKYKAFLPSLNACIQRLQILRDHVQETSSTSKTEAAPPLCSVLSQISNFPPTNHALIAHLEKQAALENSLLKLRQQWTMHQEGKEGITRSILEDLVRSFAEPETEKSRPYLSLFLQHVISLGDVLHSGRLKHYFANLRQSPKEILTSLIFEAQEYKKAAALADQLSMNLVGVLLQSLDPEAGTFEYPSKAKPKGEESDDGRNQYSLNMDVVDYVGKQSAILASLACMLRTPATRLEPDFFNYALSNTMSYAPLHNWVRLRTHMYGLFATVFQKTVSSTGNRSADTGVHGTRAPLPVVMSSTPVTMNKGTLFTSLSKGLVNESVARQRFHDDLEEITQGIESLHDLDIDLYPSTEETEDTGQPVRKGSTPITIAQPTRKSGEWGSVRQETGNKIGRDKEKGKIPSSTYTREAPSSLASSFSYKAVSSFHQQAKKGLVFDGPISAPFTQEERELFLLLGKESPADERQFCNKMLDKLVLEGKWEQALEFADTTLPFGAPDSLLRLLVDRAEDKTSTSSFIIRIRDNEVAASLVLKYLESWPIGVCLDLLSMCKHRLSVGSDSKVLERICSLYERMSVFDTALGAEGLLWKDWQSLSHQCDTDPATVVRCLIDLQQWSLARRIAELFDVPRVKLEIEESRLIDLLVNKNDTAEAAQVLGSLSKEEILPIVNVVLKNVKSFSMRLFLVQYLLSNFLDSLPTSTIEKLSAKELGLKMILQLSTEYQEQYQQLIDYPALMIESLIMSEHIHQAALLLRDFPSLRDERVITHYARKALLFPDRTGFDGSSSPIASKGDVSKTWILTGEKESDVQKRQIHRYASAPSINLAKSLLDLLADPRKAGETCLSICDSLSSSLSQSGSDDNLHAINLIQQLLIYAKLQFLRSPHATGGVSLCDTILSHVELLQSLIIKKCDLTGVTLSSFSDPQKARQLRDKLIAEDRMKMAIDVATKCNIESEPVWAAWGMALLEMGRYNDAKEKFKYCLVVSHEQRGSSVSGVVPDNVALLQRIIKVLESGPPLDPRDLRALHLNLLNSPPPSQKSGKFFDRFSSNAKKEQSKTQDPSSLDSMRFMQCVYYLRRYGTPKMLINFWARHGYYEDAMSFVVTNKLPPAVFIEELFLYCFAHSKVNQLKRAILKTDQGLEGCMEYLLALCKHLNQQQAYTVLLDFQVFMGDQVRAGLTCIKLFHESASMAAKLKYLEDAKAHFLEGLAQLQSGKEQDQSKIHQNYTSDSILNQSEINKYLRHVNLQIEVSKYFYSLQSKRGAPPAEVSDLSLFANQKQKSDIAEQILLTFNYDLAFRVMQDYRLSFQNIYASAVSKMAATKQNAKVLELLKHIKGTINDNEWDAVLMSAIRVFVEQHKDVKTAENLIGKVVSTRSKVYAYILCRKLKAAYLLAVKSNDIGLIELILDEARKQSDKTVVDLCDKYLANITGFSG